MEDRALNAFLEADLSKWFVKFSIDKFVQRRLRDHNINTVSELLSLGDVEIEETFGGPHGKLYDRIRFLHERLRHHQAQLAKRTPRRGPEKQRQSSAPSAGAEEGWSPAAHIPTPPEKEAVTNQSAEPEAAPAVGTIETSPQADELPLELPPISLGPIVRTDSFGRESIEDVQLLPFDENGLRRHVLIAGATGSGKTVAARYIVEQAAIRGIPAIVVDAQGDISSLVLQCADLNQDALYAAAAAITAPQSPGERQDLADKVKHHLEVLASQPPGLPRLYAERCLPRIFTPGRPELGLALSLPPYQDVRSPTTPGNDDPETQEEFRDLLEAEIASLVRTLLPHARPKATKGYEELLIKLFDRAHQDGVSLDGREGIQRLHGLVQQARELEPELFENYLTEKERNDLGQAIYSLGFQKEEKWLSGVPFDVESLIRPMCQDLCPVNILYIRDISDEDKKRVLWRVIVGVYKFAIERPKLAGPPSLILYIDEIGTGYGARSVGKPEARASYGVYDVLHRLVKQTRKYGVSVVLASQSYTDFHPPLRSQLLTKIIGKVDERAEQARVAASIGVDLAGMARNPRAFVESALPRLAPPLLLSVNVTGEARTYRQLKCSTLDIVLDGRNVRRWRDRFENNVRTLVDAGNRLFEGGDYHAALEKFNRAGDDGRFVSDPQPIARSQVGRCQLRLAHREEALKVFLGLDENEDPRASLVLGQELASLLRAEKDSQRYVLAMQKAIQIAQRVSPAQKDNLELELSKYHLFQTLDPEAATKHIEGLVSSSSKNISFFGRAWRQALTHFRGWARAWTFFAREGVPDPKLVEPGQAPLSVVVTKLPRDEQTAKIPTIYTSQLALKPEIVLLSRTKPEEMAESERKRLESSPDALSQAYVRQCRHLEGFRAYRAAGQLRESLEEVEAFLRDPVRVLAGKGIPNEVRELDRDPLVRRLRIADWIQDLDWLEFELEIAQMFTRMGYKAWATQPSGDWGVDVRAIREGETVIVQCKHWKQQNVGLGVVQALYGAKVAEDASRAVLVTSSSLDPSAESWALQQGIEIIDGVRLVELFGEYCDPEGAVAVAPTPSRVGSKPDARPEPKAQMPSLTGSSAPTTHNGRLVLELVRERGRIKNLDVQRLLGVSRASAGQLLRRLVVRGFLTLHGTKAVAYYTERQHGSPERAEKDTDETVVPPSAAEPSQSKYGPS